MDGNENENFSLESKKNNKTVIQHSQSDLLENPKEEDQKSIESLLVDLMQKQKMAQEGVEKGQKSADA